MTPLQEGGLSICSIWKSKKVRLVPFPPLLIESFIYITVDSWMFIFGGIILFCELPFTLLTVSFDTQKF